MFSPKANISPQGISLELLQPCIVRSVNIGTSTQFSSFWLYTPPQWISFNLRVFTSKSGERCRNYNSFYMCLPLFKGPKVMGQTNNHKSNLYFLILGCKYFAVNYSLKSGMHRHHQTLGFIPGDALPGLYCNCLQFLLVLGAFSLQFCLQQVKCMLNWIRVR